MPKRVRNLILGGGVSGLATQYFLPDQSSLILERGATVGGGCKVITVDGHSYTVGPRKLRYRPETKAVVDQVIKDTGVKVREIKGERSLIDYHGHHVRFPFQFNLADLPVLERARCVLSFLRRSGEASNFRDWCYSSYGRRISERFLLPHSRKSWKIDPSEITAKASNKVMTGGVLAGAIKGKDTEEEFVVIEGGVASMLGHMASIGGVQTSCNVVRHGIDLNKKRVVYSIGGMGKNTIEYDNLINTIPLPAFQHLIQDSVQSDVELAFESLNYNILVTVYLLVPIEDYCGPEWYRMIYYPQEDICFHRVSFPFYDGIDEIRDYVPMVAEVSVSRKYRKVIYNPDFRRRLTNKVVVDINKAGLVKESGRITFTDYNAINPGYILFDKDYEQATGFIKGWLSDKSVHQIGRFAEWNNLEIDTTLVRAKALAKNLLRQ